MRIEPREPASKGGCAVDLQFSHAASASMAQSRSFWPAPPPHPRAQADPVADFYRGKTINILIGVNVGGGYDIEARLLARFIGKHIPGNPTVVPQNMIGAGGIKMANYLYAVAPQDGTAIGMFPNTLIAAQAVGIERRAVRRQPFLLARLDEHQPADLRRLAHNRRAHAGGRPQPRK